MVPIKLCLNVKNYLINFNNDKIYITDFPLLNGLPKEKFL